MQKIITLLFIGICYFGKAQHSVLLYGNTSSICMNLSNVEIETAVNFPDSLDQYDVIFLFSSSTSLLNDRSIELLLTHLNEGKGLYIGSENWPLQAESRILTSLFCSKQSWGNFSSTNAEAGENSILKNLDSISAGNSTVAFPLDYRLKVEAWINDEPLILSGKWMNGNLLIDGGYSRFYCSNHNQTNQEMLNAFLNFLIKD